MSAVEVLLYGALLKSAWEDIRALAVSSDWLLIAWVLSAGWEVLHGHAWTVLLLLLLAAWGMGYGPGWAVWFFLPGFPYWPVLLLGAGAREGLVGQGDVLAVSLATLVSPWAGWAGLAGMLLWQAWQQRRGRLWVPGLPGVLVGVTLYWIL